MINKLCRWFSSFRKPTTLLDTLYLVAPGEVVDKVANEFPSSELLDQVVMTASLGQEEVLAFCSEKLGLKSLYSPVIPTAEAIGRCGYSSTELERHALSVFEVGSSYALVVANPDTINLDAYREIGIDIYLASGADIRQGWTQYVAPMREEFIIDEKVLIETLLSLAKRAQRLEVQEVIIGIPESTAYECVSPKGTFRGKIDHRLYSTLCSLLSTTRSISYAVLDDDILSLELTITRSGLESVIFLRWSNKDVMKLIQDPVASDLLQVHQREEEVPVAHFDILVVEDDSEFANILITLLRGNGYSVEHCSDAKTALRRLRSGRYHPSMILSDVHMPNMDGGSFLAKIVTEQPDTPVLMLTSDDDFELQAELAELGAWAFVKKQDNPQVLLSWVKNCLRRSGLSKAASDDIADRVSKGEVH